VLRENMFIMFEDASVPQTPTEDPNTVALLEKNSYCMTVTFIPYFLPF